MHVGICTHPINVLMSFYVRQIRYLLSLEMVSNWGFRLHLECTIRLISDSNLTVGVTDCLSPYDATWAGCVCFLPSDSWNRLQPCCKPEFKH